MCDIVSGAPQLHVGSVAWPHRTRFVAQRPCPVRNRFSVFHCWRGRSKPGGRADGSATRERFTASSVDHSALHADVADQSSGGGSNQIGCLEGRRAVGCDVISTLRGIRTSARTLASSLAVASRRRRCGGGILLSTGSHGTGVGRNVPVMVRIDVFNCTSTSLVWDDLDQTGEQYSAVE